MQNTVKVMKIFTRVPLTVNGLIQMIRTDKPTSLKRVKIHVYGCTCMCFRRYDFLFVSHNSRASGLVSPSADSRREVVSYWRKYVHEVLVNRCGGLNLPRKSD